MKEKTSTAVLAHGQFLPKGVWEKVMWGDPKNEILGVLARAIQIAEREEAKIFLCSAPAPIGGRETSPHVLDFIKNKFLETPDHFGLKDADLDWSELEKRSVVNEEAQNTREEVAWAAKLCQEIGIKKLVLVSPPKHIFRCHQEAVIAKEAGKFDGVEIFATASDVDFPTAKGSEVAIVEASHRSDMPFWQTHLYAQAMFSIMRGERGQERFREYLVSWGKLLEDYGVKVSWGPEK